MSFLGYANTVSLTAMPAAMSSMGVLIGVLMITFAGCTSGIGLYFLSRCALRIERGHSSFFAVAKRTYPEAAILFDSAIAIKCFGTPAI
jgi:amino acid permease